MEHNEDKVLDIEQQKFTLKELRKLDRAFQRHQRWTKEEVMHWMRVTKCQQMRILMDGDYV